MAHDGHWNGGYVTRQDNTQPHAKRECARPLEAHYFHIYAGRRSSLPPFLKVEIDRRSNRKMWVRSRQCSEKRVTQRLLRFLLLATPTSTLIRFEASNTSMRLSRSTAFGDASGKSLLSGYVAVSSLSYQRISEVQLGDDVARRLFLDAIQRLRESPRSHLRRRAGGPAA